MEREPQIRALLLKYPSKSVVFDHVMDLDRVDCKDLVTKAKLENRYINGGYSEIFVMDGTIPVNYKGTNYNIPLTIVLPLNYPSSPPILTVKPTSNMMIAPNHPNLDPNGNVIHEYLTDWKPSSDLPTLVQILRFAFSEKTPLYAKTSQPQPQTQPYSYPPQSGAQPAFPYQSNYQYQQQPQSQPPYPVGGVSSAGAWGQRAAFPPSVPVANTPGYPPQPPSSSQFPTPFNPLPPVPAQSQASLPFPTQTSSPPYPMSMSAAPVVSSYPASREVSQAGSFSAPLGQQQQQQAGGGFGQMASGSSSAVNKVGTITGDHIKASLVSAILDRARRRFNDKVNGLQDELQTLTETSSDLEKGGQKLDDILRKIENEKSTWNAHLGALRQKNQELAELLASVSTAEQSDADALVVPETPLYRQLFNAHVREQTCSEAIYVLLDALRSGADPDAVIKHVRDLSRQQFKERYLVRRCREKAGLSPD